MNLNDPRNATERGFGAMYSPSIPSRSGEMVPLRVASAEFVGGVHPALHDLLELVLGWCVRKGYELHNNPQQCWGFAWRYIRGSTSVPTNHSAGTAVDVNSATNWLGRADGGDIPRFMVVQMNAYGFRWGGDYTDRKDPMHFEFMGDREDARRLTLKAHAELGGDDMTPEQEETLRRTKAFIDAVTGPLRPGTDKASAQGAGERVAKAVKYVERQVETDGTTEH